MPANEKQLSRVKDILKLLNEGLTKDDFMRSFDVVLKLVEGLRKANKTDLERIQKGIDLVANKLEKGTADDIKKAKSDLEKLLTSTLRALQKKYEDKLLEVQEGLSEVQGRKEPDEEKIIETVLAQVPPPLSADKGEQIIDKINATPEDSEKIKKDRVEGFEELENLIQAQKVEVRTGPSRGVYLYVDGSKKGLVNTLNLIAGTGVTLTYSRASGRNDITISASGAALSLITVTGTINDSNTSFTAASEPQVVVVNGASYRHGKGCTISGTSITLDNPAGTGGDIYAIG